MAKSKSNRILPTPSRYAREHFLYVQEVGSLESLEPHISQRQDLNSFLFLTVTQGHGKFTYCGCSRELMPGDCVWVDCRKPYSHESSMDQPWTLMWVHFNGRQAESLYQYFQDLGKPYIFHPFDITPFTTALHELYMTHVESGPLSELLSNKYITDIITSSFQENKQILPNQNSIRDKLLQVRSYLEGNASGKITLEQLSEQFFISKYHLSREYKKTFGITIGATVTAKRIALAKSALRFTDEPVEQIAVSCGFQDAAYFIRVFKKAEGMTPLEYRKKW